MFLLFEFCCGTPPSCLKVMGGGHSHLYAWHSRLYAWHSRLYGGVGAHEILVSAPVPFGFRSYWDLVGVRPRGFGD